jgi:hypothetical protein
MEILEHRDQWEAGFRRGWLAGMEQTGVPDWKSYTHPQNSPLAPTPGVDLSRSRLLFITTAGAYLPDSQEPFDASNTLGDYTIRTIPDSTPLEALAYAHEHYDQTAVQTDPQVLIPLGHLADMVSAGTIGELAPAWISFMGYQPDLGRVVDELIPAIFPAAKALQADAALLVPA